MSDTAKSNRYDYDAVVVGSGFGGSVMTCRLAEAQLNVCLLERGKAYPPNSFPRSPRQMRQNFWDPSEGGYGLFNLWSFPGLEAVVSSGLGGGSLIYANVLLRKDEHWFVKEDLEYGGYEYWPVTRADLDPHYALVEQMMHVQRYPFEHPPYSMTSKTKALKEAAKRLSLDWSLPNLGVTFGNPNQVPVPGEPIEEAFENLHGRTRYTCRLTGECDIGCNYGSKNTLDYTYLSAAQRHGAHIKTLCEVRSFESLAGAGYRIHYVQHDAERYEGKKIDTSDPSAVDHRTITARRLILSAGTLGTTYLLLRNRSTIPGISTRLGSRFCGNGDLLSFLVKSTETKEGVTRSRVLDGSYGPVITSTVRVPDAADGGEGRGFYIQDAGYPDFANWMMQVFSTPGAIWAWRFIAMRLFRQWLSGQPDTDLSAELATLLAKGELASASLPLLGMGRDIPDGKMMLKGGKLDADWRFESSGPYFRRVKKVMEQIAGTLGARFVENPLWYLSRVITVHPLGGCPMGRDKREGVVNSHGEVFDCPGLYVADGSVMPGPVGANPSLTIAALANRFADQLIATHKKER